MFSDGKKKISDFLPWLVLIVTFASILLIFQKYGKHYYNADISSNIVLAEVLKKEGHILSPNWFYSTELEVLSSVHIYELFLHFFPNDWHLVRLMTIAVCLILISVSYIYMMRGAGYQSWTLLYGLCAILLPFSPLYMLMTTYGTFYISYLVFFFFQVGLIFRLKEESWKRYFRYIMLIGISVCGGMLGVRMIMMSVMPLFISGAILIVQCAYQKDSMRDLFSLKESKYFTGIIGGVTIPTLLGCLINVVIFRQKYHFYNYSESILGNLDISELLKQIRYIPEFIGYDGDVLLLSLSGINSVLSLCLTIYLLVSILALLKHQDILLPTGEARFLLRVTVISIIGGIIINIMINRGEATGSTSVSYYMPGFVLLCAFGFQLLDQDSCKMIWVRHAILLMLLCVFGFKSIMTVRSEMHNDPVDYELAAEWLMEQNCTEGYATFWNGNVLTEASNGEIEVWVIPYVENTYVFPWLQKTDHESRRPSENCFWYISDEEYSRQSEEWRRKIDEYPHEVFPNYGDRVYLFYDGMVYENDHFIIP